MKRNSLVIFGVCVLALGAALLAFADGLYSLQNEGMTPGGTTGESRHYKATTMVAEPMGNDGTSSSFGISVVIPVTAIEGPTDVPPEPQQVWNYFLGHNYPNPFNPMTTIRFDLPQPAQVTIKIYDVSGRLVRVLRDGTEEDAGSHKAIWRGRDDTGRAVAAGVYFYRLESGKFRETRRMVLIK